MVLAILIFWYFFIKHLAVQNDLHGILTHRRKYLNFDDVKLLN